MDINSTQANSESNNRSEDYLPGVLLKSLNRKAHTKESVEFDESLKASSYKPGSQKFRIPVSKTCERRFRKKTN